MSEQKVPRSVEQRIVIKFLVGENVPSAEIHHRLQQQYGEECLRHSLKVAQLLRSAACLHTNQSRSYLNHLVVTIANTLQKVFAMTHLNIILPLYCSIFHVTPFPYVLLPKFCMCFPRVNCMISHHMFLKGKAIPIQAWREPEGSRGLRLSDFTTLVT